MSNFEITRGDSPVILAMPHTGTDVPSEVWETLNEEGRKLRDTDWHIHRLYAGLLPGATMVRQKIHRYVIDANRDPSGQTLYPGQNTTGLVPLIDFDNKPLWEKEPGAAEIARRLELYHAPYHAAIGAEIERVKSKHGVAILYDCHSIRSHCPFLFEGRLPDFNIGTNGGTTCAPEIERAVVETCAAAEGYSHVLNGRFTGGWTTRHWGKPAENVHAIQMELTQSSHLATEELPFDYDEAKAAALRVHLGKALKKIEDIAYSLSGART